MKDVCPTGVLSCYRTCVYNVKCDEVCHLSDQDYSIPTAKKSTWQACIYVIYSKRCMSCKCTFIIKDSENVLVTVISLPYRYTAGVTIIVLHCWPTLHTVTLIIACSFVTSFCIVLCSTTPCFSICVSTVNVVL